MTSKGESVAKLATMIREVNTKANEALLQMSVESIKLPQSQAIPLENFPTPLHVLFSQFSNVKAIYDDQIQVRPPAPMQLVDFV